MKAMRWSVLLCALGLGTLLTMPAQASFHVMQIEQVIGGIEGNNAAQAIQLRMRSGGQNLVQQSRVKAWDATGQNPVLIIDMTTAVPNGLAGDRVLIGTAAFQAMLNPSIALDFTMTNPIPPSYLAAGSLTFEDDFGTIFWRLSWGGFSYGGPGTAGFTNDSDGNANPPFGSGLPTGTTQALKFNGAASAPSTNNAADYSITAGASVWTNNARSPGTVQGVAGVDPTPVREVQLGPPSPNPSRGSLDYTVSLVRAAHVRVAVYTAGGRLVSTLVDREMTAGHHPLSWNSRAGSGTGLASGVYYLRLDADGVRQSRKFSMIR
ncbi:MAG TPA: FlgD immunoglobulin-like domain containing protein [Candidatus Eisenbacteria bacterium]|nr:FlgD immunoglobulin-like domain containing protein [Candidatus Eisenbacteria bacterium]